MIFVIVLAINLLSKTKSPIGSVTLLTNLLGYSNLALEGNEHGCCFISFLEVFFVLCTGMDSD